MALEALDALRANRLRSILATAGLFIGVFAVSVIRITADGTAAAVGGVARTVSDTSFTVYPASDAVDRRAARLSPRDIARAVSAVPAVEDGLAIGAANRIVRYGRVRTRLAVAPEALHRFVNVPVAEGREFDREDFSEARHVCIVTADARDILAPGGAMTGTSLDYGRRCTVIGVLKALQSGFLPNLTRGDVYVPYTTFDRDFGSNRPIFAARFQVADAAQLAGAEHDMASYMREMKRGRVTYTTFDRATLTGTINAVFGTIGLVLSFVGGVSLVVAGVGVLTVMLVAVSERTREIGLRRAVGATRRSILMQFLAESVVLCLVGGLSGLAVGLVAAATVNNVFLSAISGVTPPFSWLSPTLLALGFAFGVGIIFGAYPAYRASRLDPIVALRAE